MKNGNQKKLTKKQFDLLYIAFCFRFITASDLTKYFLLKTSNTTRERLENLRAAGYLDRHYESNYRLRGRPAEYFLTPKSIPLLRTNFSYLSNSELHQIYAREKTSQTFIEHSLNLFRIHNHLKLIFGKYVDFVAKPLLNAERFNYLPHPLPDAYITLNPDTLDERSAFIEYFNTTTSIGIHSRKLIAYMHYKESGEWEATGLAFPTIAIICESLALRRQAEKRVRYLERRNLSGIDFRIIDKSSFQLLNGANEKSWINPIENTRHSL
jgi:hypothetical protein